MSFINKQVDILCVQALNTMEQVWNSNLHYEASKSVVNHWRICILKDFIFKTQNMVEYKFIVPLVL